MKNLVLLEQESKYQEYLESDNVTYPHVNLSIDENKVTVLGEEQPKCIYLPCYDTEGLATVFVPLNEDVKYNDTYQKEWGVFGAISDMYDGHNLIIGFNDDGKWYLTYSYYNYETQQNEYFKYDVTNEPLMINYLSKLNIPHFEISVSQVALGYGYNNGVWGGFCNDYLWYSGTCYFDYCEGGIGGGTME